MREKLEDEKYTRWSRKDGIWYCEPPLDMLRRMCFAHILLDDIETENGPMEIALGTHTEGRIDRNNIGKVLSGRQTEKCTGRKAMRSC